MKYATLAQGQKVLDLIVRKRVPCEQLTAILEGGLLSDLLDANVAEVDRAKLREILGLMQYHQVDVDYSVEPIDAIRSFTTVKYQNIENFIHYYMHCSVKDCRDIKRSINMTALRFRRKTRSGHAEREMSRRSLRPATLLETVNFAHVLGCNDPMVALGSPGVHPMLNSYLFMDLLSDFGVTAAYGPWPPKYCFPCVRESTAG